MIQTDKKSKAGSGRPHKMTPNIVAALKRTIGAMPMLSAHDLMAKHVRLLRNFFAAKAALPPGIVVHVLPGRKAGLARPRKMTPNVVRAIKRKEETSVRINGPFGGQPNNSKRVLTPESKKSPFF